MLSYTFRIHGEKDTLDASYINSRVMASKGKVEKLLIFFEEKEEGIERPHFHGVIRTDYKRSSIRTFIKSMTTIELKGNSQYSLKATPIEKQTYPENAYNYVCKGGVNVYNYGYTHSQIQEWIKEGADYTENKNRTNKEIQNILLEKANNIEKNGYWEHRIIELILNTYCDSNRQPPIGYQLRRLVHYVLMKLDAQAYKEMVRQQYKFEYPYGSDDVFRESTYICNGCGHCHDPLESCY